MWFVTCDIGLDKLIPFTIVCRVLILFRHSDWPTVYHKTTNDSRCAGQWSGIISIHGQWGPKFLTFLRNSEKIMGLSPKSCETLKTFGPMAWYIQRFCETPSRNLVPLPMYDYKRKEKEKSSHSHAMVVTEKANRIFSPRRFRKIYAYYFARNNYGIWFP